MPLNITEIRTQIAATQAAIDKVLNAQSYGKGDLSAQRAELSVLRQEMSILRREEAQLIAASSGAKNPGVLGATFS